MSGVSAVRAVACRNEGASVQVCTKSQKDVPAARRAQHEGGGGGDGSEMRPQPMVSLHGVFLCVSFR